MQSPGLNLTNYIKQHKHIALLVYPYRYLFKVIVDVMTYEHVLCGGSFYFNVKARRLAAKCKCPFSLFINVLIPFFLLCSVLF